MKNRIRTLSLLVTVAASAFVIYRNSSGKNGEIQNLAEFIGTVISIPQEAEPAPERNGTLVVYYDSATCSTCMLKHIDEWDGLFPELNENTGKNGNDVQILFIFEPGRGDIERFVSELSKDSLPYHIFSDFNGTFKLSNNRLIGNRNLHTFLLDRNDRVILAGSPLHNTVLRDTYGRFIDELNGNGGELSDEFRNSVVETVRNRSVPADGLFFVTDHADVGEVRYGEVVTVTFDAFNRSDSLITVQEIMTDCDCMEATVTSKSVESGERTLFNVTFTADDKGKFIRDLFIRMSGVGEDRHLTITGNCI